MCRLVFVVLLGILALGPPTAGAQTSTTATGVSRTMNPALSVNGLFRAQMSSQNAGPEHNRIALQEAEAQFTSIVDPFWKANLILALHPAHHHADSTGEDHAHGMELDVEEAYLDGRSLPAGLALRLGKFFLPFGKHVPLHTHQFPFAEAPLAVQAFLGDHGLTEVGALVTATVPVPWYSDLRIYGVNGDAEIFDAENTNLAWGGRLTNLWDVSATATLELGASGLLGPDGQHPGKKKDLRVLGADLTYKWVSGTRSKGPALTVTGEVILPRPQEREGDPLGWYALAQYRVHRNWWMGASHGRADSGLEPDFSAVPAHGQEAPEHHHDRFTDDVWETKFNLTFAPSEFSALRAEVGWFNPSAEGEDDLWLSLQCNFTIGSHPAHLY